MVRLTKELLAILEAEQSRTFELEELVKTFSNRFDVQKHAAKLWGSKLLTYKGQPFFTDSGIGEIQKYADETGRKALNGKHAIEVDVSLKHENRRVFLTVDNMQEVYLGYSIERDMFYIGYDMWLDTSPLESAFEDMYEDAFGEPLDDASPEVHERWRQFEKHNGSFYGGLVELATGDGLDFDDYDVLETSPGGFYRAIYDKPLFRSMDLIDLRLD